MTAEEETVRAKWTFDGAESIEQMAVMLEEKAEWLRKMEKEGWKLRDTVQDDYAFLERKP